MTRRYATIDDMANAMHDAVVLKPLHTEQRGLNDYTYDDYWRSIYWFFDRQDATRAVTNIEVLKSAGCELWLAEVQPKDDWIRGGHSTCIVRSIQSSDNCLWLQKLACDGALLNRFGPLYANVCGMIRDQLVFGIVLPPNVVLPPVEKASASLFQGAYNKQELFSQPVQGQPMVLLRTTSRAEVEFVVRNTQSRKLYTVSDYKAGDRNGR